MSIGLVSSNSYNSDMYDKYAHDTGVRHSVAMLTPVRTKSGITGTPFGSPVLSSKTTNAIYNITAAMFASKSSKSAPSTPQKRKKQTDTATADHTAASLPSTPEKVKAKTSPDKDLKAMCKRNLFATAFNEIPDDDELAELPESTLESNTKENAGNLLKLKATNWKLQPAAAKVSHVHHQAVAGKRANDAKTDKVVATPKIALGSPVFGSPKFATEDLMTDCDISAAVAAISKETAACKKESAAASTVKKSVVLSISCLGKPAAKVVKNPHDWVLPSRLVKLNDKKLADEQLYNVGFSQNSIAPVSVNANGVEKPIDALAKEILTGKFTDSGAIDIVYFADKLFYVSYDNRRLCAAKRALATYYKEGYNVDKAKASKHKINFRFFVNIRQSTAIALTKEARFGSARQGLKTKLEQELKEGKITQAVHDQWLAVISVQDYATAVFCRMYYEKTRPKGITPAKKLDGIVLWPKITVR